MFSYFLSMEKYAVIFECFKFIKTNVAEYGLSWWIFCDNLKRLYALQLLDRMFYQHRFSQVDWQCYLHLLCPLIFFLVVLSSIKREMLKFPIMIANLSISFIVLLVSFHIFWNSVSRYIHFGTAMSFWWTYPFIIMECSILSLVIFFILKFALSHSIIETSPFWCLLFAWYIFFHTFTFNLSV